MKKLLKAGKAPEPMSKTRYVNTRFWDDSYIAELEPIDKLFFIYLLTNSAVELSGIYELPLKKISFETGIPSDRLSIGFDRLSRDKKIYYIDGWVVIKNFLRHQSTNPKMLKGAERCFNEIPLRIWEKIMSIEDLRIAYHSLSKAFLLNLTILNLTLPNGIAPKRERKKVESKNNPVEPTTEPDFVYEEKIKTMLSDHDPRMPIIAEYWKAKSFAFENRKQYDVALKRELRAAGDLTGYAIEQVKKTLDWLKNNANFKWTLETVGKYINEPLDALSTSGKPKTEDDWMQELRAKERQYATQQFT